MRLPWQPLCKPVLRTTVHVKNVCGTNTTLPNFQLKVKLTVLLKIPEVSFEGPAQIPQCHSHGCPCPNLQCLQFHPQGQDNDP